MQDDQWRELLRSPLDDPDRKRPRGVAAALVGIALVGGVLVVTLIALRSGGGNGGAEGAPPRGPVTTAPAGTVDYPEETGSPVAAYDATRDRIIVVDGLDSAAPLADNPIHGTWAYDAETDEWRRLESAVAPAARVTPAAAIADDAGVLVLFGGARGPTSFCSALRRCADASLGDTWHFDLAASSWEPVATQGSPPARYGAALAHDPDAGVIVLFGGATDAVGSLLGDTWTYDPVTGEWSAQQPAAAPAPRAYHQMAYDPGTGRVMLHGGVVGTVTGAGDPAVWSYDASQGEWTAHPAGGEAPPPIWSGVLATGSPGGSVLLAGGIGKVSSEVAAGVSRTDIVLMDSVWAYDLEEEAWTNPVPGPAPIGSAAGALDRESGLLVMLADGHTYVYEPATGRWDDRTPPA